MERQSWKGNHGQYRRILPGPSHGDDWLNKNFRIVLWCINRRFSLMWRNTGVDRGSVLDYVLLQIATYQRYRKPEKYSDNTFLALVTKQAIIECVRRFTTSKARFNEAMEQRADFDKFLVDGSLQHHNSNKFFELLDLVEHPKAKYVLFRRFYLNETLEEIGTEMRLTKERVRQLEEKGLKIIRKQITI